MLPRIVQSAPDVTHGRDCHRIVLSQNMSSFNLFMMNGGNLYALQKLLSHSDFQTTMIYAHLVAKFLKQSIDLIRLG
jgi:site-specific recombinase XerC